MIKHQLQSSTLITDYTGEQPITMINHQPYLIITLIHNQNHLPITGLIPSPYGCNLPFAPRHWSTLPPRARICRALQSWLTNCKIWTKIQRNASPGSCGCCGLVCEFGRSEVQLVVLFIHDDGFKLTTIFAKFVQLNYDQSIYYQFGALHDHQ